MNDNLRIIFDNAADRAQVAASSQVGNLTAGNLHSDLKSKVWRGESTTEAIVMQWERRTPVGGVVLAFNNLTPFAKARLRGYEHAISTYASFETEWAYLAAPGPLGMFQWGAPLGENFYQRGGASMFAYGYGSYGCLWLPGGRAVHRLEIEIEDPKNPDGYIEAGRLIAGPYWSPLYNFDFNHSLSFEDQTKNTRTEAGDLRGEPGASWRRATFNLSYLAAEDRSAILRLMRLNGTRKPFFVSLFPENQDKILEQSYQIWGKLAGSSKVSQPRYDIYATQLDIEEI